MNVLRLCKNMARDYKFKIGRTDYVFASLVATPGCDEWILFIGVEYSSQGKPYQSTHREYADAVADMEMRFSEWLNLAGLKEVG